MHHSLVMLLQANDLLIACQTKAIDPELGAAIAILTRIIDKKKCRACNGIGYLPTLAPCPACQRTGTEGYHGSDRRV